MATERAINTRTLAVITITVTLVTTTQQKELQVQIVKLAAPGNTLVPHLPPARLVPQERFSSTLSPVTSLWHVRPVKLVNSRLPDLSPPPPARPVRRGSI